MPSPSERASQVTGFAAMDVLERANAMDDVVHMEVGEPDFGAPDAAVDAAVEALEGGRAGYTATKGTPELRAAISDYYERRYGVGVDPGRIVVTPGSSPALLLSLAAAVDPGETVALTDPYYAPYPNLVRTVGGRVRTVPLDPAAGFRLRPADAVAALDGDPAAMLVNSPANPTGAVLSGETLSALVERAGRTGTTLLVDEIYHGLTYDVEERSVLEFTDEAYVLDGVSKRYGMTGWRLG